MTGQYQHSIDAKGRVFIPAKLREELGETFYVTMGMDSCLSVYSDASWAKFTEKFESLPYTKTKAMRPLFANAAKCEPDSQGRILLPQKLRAYAGLDKDVVIIGVSNRAEIWNAERWAALEAEELNPENLADGRDQLRPQTGAAARMPGRACHQAGRRLPRRDAGPRGPLAGDRPPPDGGRTAHCPRSRRDRHRGGAAEARGLYGSRDARTLQLQRARRRAA